MRFLPLAGLLALGACVDTTPAGPARPPARVFAFDQQGKAAKCAVQVAERPADGATVTGTMAVLNDRGWCGVELLRPVPGWEPFLYGLLTKRAEHGTVTIHTVGDTTRADYLPDVGYAGPDAFTLKLAPGNAVVQVAVTVEAPPAPPPSPPAATPAPAPRPAAPAAQRPTQRRTP
jgi:hypothetical protein